MTKAKQLEELKSVVLGCTKCPLWEGRNHVVCGEGNPDADLVFIGEAPGRNEDLEGRPFVGRAGALLSQHIQAIGLSREEVFIGNILKCRPPNNRDPLPEEIQCCEPYLLKQLEIIEPKVICALGRYAAHTLLRITESISKMRGNIYYYHGIKVLPTFHPASMLYHPQNTEEFEKDFRLLRKIYDQAREENNTD
jgi:DNA polymerase